MPLLLTAFLLTACQPVTLLNAVIPKQGFSLQSDICFGEHPRQCLDLYKPLQEHADAVVVFVYGGAWDQGSKNDFFFVGEAFANMGYITALPDYRIYPEVVFPAFIEDVAAAIAVLDEHLGYTPAIILAGHSAGAHTAALLASAPEFLQQAGVNPERLRALIALSGPHDLPLQHERVVDKFPDVEPQQVNPLLRADASHPPALLLHGLRDRISEPAHSKRYAEVLHALGVPVELQLYEGRRHVDMVASLARPLRFLSPVHRDIREYLDNL